jgi:NAD(P)-dependent dehydrogenase (short-subunit alcohol dehydrogenase family)
MNLSGKVAVVTGAATGIGKSCVETLYNAGAFVVLADIDSEGGNAVATQLGDRALFLRADVRKMADMQKLADHAQTRFGGIDILVNNAALAIGGVVDEIDEDDWAKVIDTNLTGYWRTMRTIIPYMRKRGGGSIVNVSSVQGLRGFPGWPAYAAAKGGINALTVQTAVDLAPASIRVNAVAPGTIMTPMNEKIFADQPDGGKVLRQNWNEAHPLGRFGQPPEVAKAVLFLASDDASFITGEIIRIDGGLAIKGA